MYANDHIFRTSSLTQSTHNLIRHRFSPFFLTVCVLNQCFDALRLLENTLGVCVCGGVLLQKRAVQDLHLLKYLSLTQLHFNKHVQILHSSHSLQCSSPLSTAYEDPVEDLIRELIILLDPDDTCSDAGDWRALAEKMGCGLTRIRWLGTQTSKTRLLIEKWMEDKRSFTELRDVLFRINRPDAAHEVERRLNHLEPNRRNQRHTDFVQRAENKGDIGHRSENCALGNKDGNRGSGKRDRKCVSEQFARRESGISGGICACRNSDRNNDSGKTGLNHALGITVSGDLQNGNGLNDLGKKDNSGKRENGCTLENRFETGKSENADIRKAVENTDDVSYCKHSDDSNMSVI